jgi:hypothetical protein
MPISLLILVPQISCLNIHNAPPSVHINYNTVMNAQHIYSTPQHHNYTNCGHELYVSTTSGLMYNPVLAVPYPIRLGEVPPPIIDGDTKHRA